MRHPWLSDSNDAEMEALQTDVMRFVAILGLCLAAIFSLVQRASLEQPPPVINPVSPVRAPAQTLAPRPDMPIVRAPLSKASTRESPAPAKPAVDTPEPSAPTKPITEAAQPSTPAESQIGFSLEFASAADLMALLENGQIQLYAELYGQFWSADPRGRFTLVEAPSSYYRMDPATVPGALIGSLQRSTKAVGAIWGVVLSPAIVEQMERLTSATEGGNLVILRSGHVQLEAR